MLFINDIIKWPQEEDHGSPVGWDEIEMAKPKKNDASWIKIVNKSQAITTKTKMWPRVNKEFKSFKLGATEYQT